MSTSAQVNIPMGSKSAPYQHYIMPPRKEILKWFLPKDPGPKSVDSDSSISGSQAKVKG